MSRFIEFSGGDVAAYLQAQERKDMLRFITCGSVDDGKSTLIGRLLYESKMLFEDQLSALEADSKKMGTQGGNLDFALLVDGLAAEREQGSTTCRDCKGEFILQHIFSQNPRRPESPSTRSYR